jgi:DNA polymerase-3 subunit alpha
MDAVAVTDHGNMHAAVSFYKQAKAAGIKPILGVEAYVAPGDRPDRTYTGVQDGGYHLVLLAENQKGWENLLYLCSEAYLTGFYFKPRMDREMLETHGEGIIAINGHLGSELAAHMVRFEETKDEAHWKAAVEVCDWHRKVFAPTEAGPRFYVELQHHIREQIAINPHLIRLAREQDLPLVCDNDSHFLLERTTTRTTRSSASRWARVKDDPPSGCGTPPSSTSRAPSRCGTSSGATSTTTRSTARRAARRCDNTKAIADRCEVELPLGANHAPVVSSSRRRPNRATAQAQRPAVRRRPDRVVQGLLLASSSTPPTTPTWTERAHTRSRRSATRRCACSARRAWSGATARDHRTTGMNSSRAPTGLATRASSSRVTRTNAFDKWARLNRELKILADKLISAYFLIVWDFVNWARQHGIPRSPVARASARWSATCSASPTPAPSLRPALRALHRPRPDRVPRYRYRPLPGRAGRCHQLCPREVRPCRADHHLRDPQGPRRHPRRRPRARDPARRGRTSLAKLIPEELKITLDKALDAGARAQEAGYDTRHRSSSGSSTPARVLEGQARHASSTPPASIVATRPLDEIVPLYKQSGLATTIITQWDGPTCEKMGLLKMDFLGLRTLSIIERAKKLIRETLPSEKIYAIWRWPGGPSGSPSGDVPQPNGRRGRRRSPRPRPPRLHRPEASSPSSTRRHHRRVPVRIRRHAHASSST